MIIIDRFVVLAVWWEFWFILCSIVIWSKIIIVLVPSAREDGDASTDFLVLLKILLSSYSSPTYHILLISPNIISHSLKYYSYTKNKSNQTTLPWNTSSRDDVNFCSLLLVFLPWSSKFCHQNCIIRSKEDLIGE